MATIAALKNQINELASKGLEIASSSTLPASKAVAQMNRIDAQLKPLLDELKDLEYVEERKHALGFNPFVAGSAAGVISTASTGSSSVGGAPLALTREDTERLFKSARAGESITVKAPTLTATVDPATAPNSVLPPIGIRRDPTRILDRMPVTATDAAVNRYYIASASGAGAGITAEGAQKPLSDLTLTKQDAVAAKIAVWGQVSEEALEDFAGFESFLTADYRDQIIDAETAALLNATGVAPATFKGLLQVTGTQTTTRTGTDTALDAISAAFDSLRAGGRYVEPDTICMNPVDLGKIRRLKSTTNEYLLGSPSQSGPTDIWGVPVVVTSKIAVGTVIVANLRQATTVFLRSGLTIRTNANGSGFRNNLIEIVAEERLSLGVVAPAAVNIVTVT